MKRYIYLLITSLVVLIVCLSFIFSNQTDHKYVPKLSLNNYGGDVSDVEDLVVDGHVSFYHMGLGEPFRLDGENVTYFSELSYLDQIDNNLSKNEYNQLKKKYHSFMRGKNEHNTLITETDDYIAVVSTPEKLLDYKATIFDIGLIDKETEKVVEMKEEIPNYEAYLYIDIVDLFVNDNQLYVTASHLKEGNGDTQYGGGTEEVFVHQFDMKEEVFIDTEPVTSVKLESDENKSAHLEITRDEADEGVLYLLEKITHYDAKGNDSTKLSKVSTYNIINREEETFNVSEIEREVSYLPTQLYDGKIYYLTEEDNKGKLNAYDVKIGEENSTFLPDMSDQLSGTVDYVEDNFMTVEDEKLYIVPSYVYTGDGSRHIYVYDTNTLESLYVGEFMIEHEQLGDLSFELNVHDLYFN